MSDAETWNRVRFDPRDRGGHVESHFLKATSPDAARAIWLRITTLAPKGAPEEAISEAWAVAFERGKPPIGVKESVPARAAEWTQTPFRIAVPSASLDGSKARGTVRTGGRTIAWDLAFESHAPPFDPYPLRGMYEGPLPRSKLVSPHPDARFTGTVDVDGARWDVVGWPGMQGHNWGRGNAARYAWAHCNAFDDAAPGTWLEGFTGQVKIGPVRTPLVTMIGVCVGGRVVRFTDLAGTFRRHGEIAYYRWSFRAAHEGHRVEGEVDLEKNAIAGLRYENPSGPTTHCLNGKLARIEAVHRAPNGAETRLSSRAAALEIGTHDTDHGVPMIL